MTTQTPAEVFIHEARAEKASKLADQLVTAIENTEIVTGVTFTPDKVLDLGQQLTAVAWAKLAQDAQTTEPSRATQILAVRLAASTVRSRGTS